MIRLAEVDYKDVQVKDVSGLYDFPAIKTDGNDWLGEDYIEALPRKINFQYESKTITLDCFMAADNWSELETSIQYLVSELIFDGLKMLVVPDYSVRGYMVRLKKTTIFKPLISFSEGKTVAEFKLVFEEPQPFNVQFSYYSEDPFYELFGDIIVSKLTKSLSFGSDEQRYVTVHVSNSSYEENIEQDDCTVTLYLTATGFNRNLSPFPVIVTGDIDSIEGINISNTTNLVGLEAAAYFLRNGLIS